jgi:hypothetical protein
MSALGQIANRIDRFAAAAVGRFGRNPRRLGKRLMTRADDDERLSAAPAGSGDVRRPPSLVTIKREAPEPEGHGF